MPQISDRSPNANEKICIDIKTFSHVVGLICRSTDIVNNARHREIFLDSLNTYLIESTEMDDSDCFRASLLPDAYYEYVPANLEQLGSTLDEILQIMKKVEVMNKQTI